MIETKEKYEEWREAIEKFPNLRMWPDDMCRIVETIEALREVARTANRLEISYDMRTGDMTIDGFRNQIEDLERAIDALPDWLTDE